MVPVCVICKDVLNLPDGEYQGRFVHQRCILKELRGCYTAEEVEKRMAEYYLPEQEGEWKRLLALPDYWERNVLGLREVRRKRVAEQTKKLLGSAFES
jgi:hypothetical protein